MLVAFALVALQVLNRLLGQRFGSLRGKLVCPFEAP